MLEPEVAAADSSEGLVLSLHFTGSSVEPRPLVAGQSFTIMLALLNDLPYELRSVRFDLEISGPTGIFKFPLSARGPFPSGGIFVVPITPEGLSEPAHDKYLIEPTDIFGIPGRYVLRFTLQSPAVVRER